MQISVVANAFTDGICSEFDVLRYGVSHRLEFVRYSENLDSGNDGRRRCTVPQVQDITKAMCVRAWRIAAVRAFKR